MDMRYSIPTAVGRRAVWCRFGRLERICHMADLLTASFADAVDLQDRATFYDIYPWRLRVPW